MSDYVPPYRFVERFWLSNHSVDTDALNVYLVDKCPQPKYDQTVYEFDTGTKEYKRLWDIPPKNISDAILRDEYQDGVDYISERSNMKDLYNYALNIIRYKYGILHETADKYNEISAMRYRNWLEEQEEAKHEEGEDDEEETDRGEFVIRITKKTN